MTRLQRSLLPLAALLATTGFAPARHTDAVTTAHFVTQPFEVKPEWALLS